MSEFALLRSRMLESRSALERAQEAGLEHEVQLHSAKLRSLTNRAAEIGVDVSDWVPVQ